MIEASAETLRRLRGEPGGPKELFGKAAQELSLAMIPRKVRPLSLNLNANNSRLPYQRRHPAQRVRNLLYETDDGSQ
jgi:hypothetical protein